MANSLQKLAKFQYSIDYVMHFAAHKNVAESIEKPLMYYRNNLIGTLTLLQVLIIKVKILKNRVTEDRERSKENEIASRKLVTRLFAVECLLVRY